MFTLQKFPAKLFNPHKFSGILRTSQTIVRVEKPTCNMDELLRNPTCNFKSNRRIVERPTCNLDELLRKPTCNQDEPHQNEMTSDPLSQAHFLRKQKLDSSQCCKMKFKWVCLQWQGKTALGLWSPWDWESGPASEAQIQLQIQPQKVGLQIQTHGSTFLPMPTQMIY